VSPEAANNAADQTAFIPTMTLGIPGSASTAIILGVLMIHGIMPGPRLVTETPEVFWTIIMSFWLGNVMLLLLNLPLIGIWVRLVTIPYTLLYPSVLVFVCVGIYTVAHSTFDIWLVLLFGLLGYLMRILSFPPAPLVLGFVLGPMTEENFRRSLVISRGDFSIFYERPVSGAILALTLLILLWTAWGSLRALMRRSREQQIA
jgi:TctA family transporter